MVFDLASGIRDFKGSPKCSLAPTLREVYAFDIKSGARR